MALTPFYGFSYFGQNTPGALTDDGSKYTGADRLLLDRMLHGLAAGSRHLHEYDAIDEPNTPTADLGTSGGLPGGTAYSYVVTYVDTEGLESLPSAEVTVTTPAVLPAPDAPDLDDEDGDGLPLDGTLPAGLWFYAVTALRGTEESPLSPQISITTVVDGAVSVLLPAPPVDTSINAQVWRMSPADIGWTRIGVLPFVEGDPFLDDGSVTANLNADDPLQQPPVTNTGQDIYSVTVTLAVPDQDLATTRRITAWRLYRTETSGAYPAASLVHHVNDLDDPGDTGDPTLPLVITWTDEGDILLDGAPPLASQSLQLAPYVFDVVDTTLPAYASYPRGYPLMHGGQLYVRGATSWVLVSGTSTAGSVQIFTQDIPDTTWSISHTYDYFPDVDVVDSDGNRVFADVHHDTGLVTITAEYAFAGTAHLS